MRRFDFEDVMMYFVGTVFVLFLGGMIGYIGCSLFDEAILKRRAFESTIACEQQRMVPRRKFLSSAVICVPAVTRQDTTTVHVQ